jgi:iron(III) transport system substrate-binding protein
MAWAACCLALPASSAMAASRNVAEVAAYMGPDRQQLLEAGAREEGELLIYTIGAQTDPLYAAFGKKYPFIKVGTYKGDTATVIRRMVEEYGAARYLPDVIDLNTLRLLRDAGLLQAYASPELAKFDPRAVESNRFWTVAYQSYVGLGFNTKLVSEAEAPKTLDDLLDPKWSGKMAIAGPTTLGNWIGALLRDKDEAYVRKLGTQKIRLLEVIPRAVLNLVISGEFAMSPMSFSSHVAASAAEGAAVAWRPLGGAYTTLGGVALAARAPHPNAAMLYIDFELSPEGQGIYRKLGYVSARSDFPQGAAPTKAYDLTAEPDYLANYEKWNALGREVFGK